MSKRTLLRLISLIMFIILGQWSMVARLCPRSCGVDRSVTKGYCRMGDMVSLSYYSLHKWEEPPISGERGSGTIFFDGCSLGCLFCQNKDISRGRNGKTVTDEERRLLRVPWRAGRSNQSILKEINPEYSLEGLMLKL